MATRQVEFRALITGVLTVESDTEEQAAEMAKNLLGTAISTAVILHPVRTAVEVAVRPANGLVTPSNISPLNRAQRRADGRK